MIDSDTLQLFIAAVVPLYGLQLWTIMAVGKLKSSLHNCIYCEKSKEIIKKEIENI